MSPRGEFAAVPPDRHAAIEREDFVGALRRDAVIDDLLEVVVVVVRELVASTVGTQARPLSGTVLVSDESVRRDLVGLVVRLHDVLRDACRVVRPFLDDLVDAVWIRLLWNR